MVAGGRKAGSINVRDKQQSAWARTSKHTIKHAQSGIKLQLSSTVAGGGRAGVQLLKIRERVLGQEHPKTLLSMSNLAIAYDRQGRQKEAEELVMQVVEVEKRVLGHEHPDILKSIAILLISKSRDKQVLK
jgi:Tetratricopeptide repeat